MAIYIVTDSTGAIINVRRSSNPDAPVLPDYVLVSEDDPEVLSIDVFTHYVTEDGVIQRYSPEVSVRRMQNQKPGFTWHAREGVWIDNRSFDDRREEKKQQVDAERERRNLLPIEYAGAVFDADETAQRNVSAWMTNIAAGMALPTGFVWRDFNNVDHPADNAYVVGMGAAMTLRGTQLYQSAWNMKAQLAAMTTIAEVEAFDPVGTGWLTGSE